MQELLLIFKLNRFYLPTYVYNMHYLKITFFLAVYLFSITTKAQLATIADSLRGSINANRSWWDVKHYNISVTPNLEEETIIGSNIITFKCVAAGKTMQMDLQKPLLIQNINFGNTNLIFTQKNNIALITFSQNLIIGNEYKITINYLGKPKKAIRAPWDGGIVWEKDLQNRPYINTACQGLGASVWWPCKDHQSDEPDSMLMHFTVPENLVAVGNGKLRSITANNNNTKTFTWAVTNPINTYCATMNIGNYVNFSDTLNGENGVLTLDYWVMDFNLEKAKKQFVQAKQTIRAMEYWYGAYPFYEDNYKLIETHHLGMEHQSGVAYGNKYMNGYLGSDLSGSGWGLKWDYIIVHESGHEWFGNSITTNDIADMWVHEGFTDYCETLFINYYYGKEAGDAYVQGIRNNIENDKPIIGPYGVNKEGSSDMYYKGANMLHTIRTLINNDSLFRNILRGLNKKYYHQTVNTNDIETYISQNAKIDFSKVFDEYLRTTNIPTINYKIKKTKNNWQYNFTTTNVVKGFTVNVPITTNAVIKVKNFVLSDAKPTIVNVLPNTNIAKLISPNLYFIVKEKK